MRSLIIKIALIVCTPLGLYGFAQNDSSAASILNQAASDAHMPLPGWKKIGIQAARDLDNSLPSAVTAALYDLLRRDGPDGTSRSMVARIAQTTSAFLPELWLDIVDDEQDSMIKTAAFMIFYGTQFREDKRFSAMLKVSLKDTRVGGVLVGEGHAYSSVGTRVCDEAYNMLMEGRTDRPPEFPLDVSGDDMSTRNRLIMKLCAELGVSGPLSPDAILPKLTTTNSEAATDVGFGKPLIPPGSQRSTSNHEPILDLPWSVMIVLILVVVALLWFFLKKRGNEETVKR